MKRASNLLAIRRIRRFNAGILCASAVAAGGVVAELAHTTTTTQQADARDRSGTSNSGATFGPSSPVQHGNGGPSQSTSRGS